MKGITLKVKIPLALLSGALFWAITAPRPLYPLQWLAFVPLLLVLRDNSPRRDFLLGWLMGVALNLTAFFWISSTVVEFGGLPWPVGLLALAAFAAYSGLPYGLLAVAVPRLRRAIGPWYVLVVPALWVAIELVFPLLFSWRQGDLQFRWRPVLQIAAITGVYGVSYLVLAVNLALADGVEALRRRRRPAILPLAAVGVLLAVSVGWGVARIARLDRALAEAPTWRMGLIQANLGVHERDDLGSRGILELHTDMSDDAIDRGAELLFWGEGACPYYPGRKWKRVERYIKSRKVPLITGAVRREKVDGEKLMYNSAISLTPEEATAGEQQVYDKLVLLMFGEYMPLSGVIPGLAERVENVQQLTPGAGPVTLEIEHGGRTVRVAPLICYEAIMPRLSRRQARGGADVLANLTHDAWFGDTDCPHQFLMLVVPRAVEHGCTVVRVANTGISAVVDPTGAIRARTGLFEVETLVEDVPVKRFGTVYTAVGDGFAWVCCAGSVVAIAVAVRRRKRS